MTTITSVLNNCYQIYLLGPPLFGCFIDAETANINKAAQSL